MGEECSVKIWTLGPHIELASYKPRIDPVATTIIAILLPTQNVELSSTSLLKPSPRSPALHHPRLFSKQTYQEMVKCRQILCVAEPKYKQDHLNISCLKSLN